LERASIDWLHGATLVHARLTRARFFRLSQRCCQILAQYLTYENLDHHRR
jgi:hypothetical protein